MCPLLDFRPATGTREVQLSRMTIGQLMENPALPNGAPPGPVSRPAFPQEAAQADTANDLTILVNDQTVFRATATFLRTVVTRNTPFDKFLAGDNNALTPAQVRGAQLFFTPATGGAGGAGCFTCHSGPMLNKQYNDPDVAGIGQFI